MRSSTPYIGRCGAAWRIEGAMGGAVEGSGPRVAMAGQVPWGTGAAQWVVASRYRVVAAARQSTSRHRAAQRTTPPFPGTVSVGRTGGRTLPAPGMLLWRPNGWYTLRGPHAAPQQSPRRVPCERSCQKVSRLPSRRNRTKKRRSEAPCDTVQRSPGAHYVGSRILTRYNKHRVQHPSVSSNNAGNRRG